MIYTLRVTVEALGNMPARQHEPISIRTFTNSKSEITSQEIDMVAEAFRRQIKLLLIEMAK